MSKNFQKTCFPLLQYLRPDIMAKGSITYTRKIRIYPSKNQIEFFNKCFGTHRYFYNQTLQLIKEYCDKRQKEVDKFNKLKEEGCVYFDKKQCCNAIPKKKKYFCKEHKKEKIKTKYDIGLTLASLRKMVMTKKIEEENPWQKEIPYDTRQLAIKEFIGSYKSCLSNIRNDNIDSFDMTFKNRRNPKQIFSCRLSSNQTR